MHFPWQRWYQQWHNQTYSFKSSWILILIIFNMIWTSSQCPKRWTEATLIPLLKPKEPQAYRPIALTSTICKLMERMVNNRLTCSILKNLNLSNQQCGFRKGRSTKDHIIQLESSINKAFANKESTLVAVFLDLEKAYAWHVMAKGSHHQTTISGDL